jgi:hypothetical protein
VRSILTLKNTKRIGSKHYSRTYERFDFISHFSDAVSNSEYLLTEDSNAGFEAYEKLTEGTSCVCISAKGKSNIPRVILARASRFEEWAKVRRKYHGTVSFSTD